MSQMMSGAEGLAPPRRQLAMLAICLGVVLSSLDGAMANVALPAIGRTLGSSPSGIIWVATAYQLGVVVALLPFSAVGEAHGYRRVYLAGMAVFTGASLGCALASSLPALVAMRGLQGLAGGAMVGVSMALVRFTYPKERLGRALAMYGLVAAAGLTAGPSVASAILAFAPWPWLFAVNVPIGIVAMAFGWRVLPPSPRTARAVDWPAAAVAAVALVLVIVGVDGLGERAKTVYTAAAIVGGLALGAALMVWQGRREAPLVPVDLLRRPVFALSAGTAVCVYAAQTAAFVALPFHLLTLLHRGQVETGLLITPFPAMIVLAAPLVGRLADRYPAGLLTGIGMAVLAVGLASLTRLGPESGSLDIVLRMALCGAGFGLFQAPNNRAMMTAAPPARSGAASATVALARVGGQALGSAAAAVALGLFGARGPVAALWAGAGLAVVAGVLSVSRLGAAKP